jgi:hypothetical protein
MRRNRREAGEGQGGCLVGIVFLLVAVFISYKLIPVKVKAADLRGVIVDEAKSAGAHGDDRIRKAILDEAVDQGLPVTDDNITILRAGNLIRVDVDYVVPVVFPGYTYQWHFHHHAENPVF